VAFKVAGPRVSVLALEAPIYCSEGGPSERFAGRMVMFPEPTLLSAGPRGPESPLRPNGGPSSYIAAAVDGTALTGTFAFDVTEGSFHCQTVGYYPSRPAVPFETVLAEPVGSGPTLPPAKGEAPIFYADGGPLEVLLQIVDDSIEIRGAVRSDCPVRGVKPSRARVSLFPDVTGAKRRLGGFRRTTHHQGKTKDGLNWSETTSVSGAIGAREISGVYSRTTTTRTANGPPRRCTTGTLPFRAPRYLPAAGR